MRILTRRSLLPTWRRPPLLLLGAALGLWLATAGTALPAAGDLDASFGAGGRAVVDLGADESAEAVALAPDGRIVVGGSRQNPAGTDGIVARLTPQGAIDTTYGGSFGWSRLDYGPDDPRPATSSCSRTDGSWPPAPPTRGNAFVARCSTNPGGELDPTFVGVTGTFSELRTVAGIGYPSVVLQPDGRILAVGTVPSVPPGESDIAAVRLTSAGAFDRSYGPQGLRVVAHQLPAGPGARVVRFRARDRPRAGREDRRRRPGRAPSPPQLRGRAPAQPPGDARPLVRGQRHRQRPDERGLPLRPRSRSSPTGRSSSPAPRSTE